MKRTDFRPNDNANSSINDKDKKTIHEIRQQTILNKSTLNKDNVESKGFIIETHSNKRTELEYKQLIKPKIKYYVNNKDNTIREINKTEYDNLSVKSDNDKNKLQVKYSGYVSDNLYDRYKDKDYQHLNYLSNDEKKENKNYRFIL